MSAYRLRTSLGVASILFGFVPAGLGEDFIVNGGFETAGGLGWNTWKAPWGDAATYDFGWSENPFEGNAALRLSSSRGSFGVYQELCVPPGIEIQLRWNWRGSSAGNGWWEVLIVDAPYSYEAVDDPKNHPETFLAAKWETGFGGPYPGPEAEWTPGVAPFQPTSEVITVVLKCGSTEGGLVEAWFDAVRAEFETDLLEVASVTPAIGKTAGGDAVSVRGRVFPDAAAVTLGGRPLAEALRASTCELRGLTPPGDPGFVDLVVATPRGSATLPGAFRYVPPPTVASIEPSSGPIEGGTEVTVRGEHFVSVRRGDVKVLVGGKALAGTAVADERTITGRTPPGAEGPADVVVTTPFGETTLAGGFLYGASGPRFVRGDCNADGELNITDGIAALGFLFLGGAEPPCLEACNTDDGADLNISDAIAILNFLFLGGQGPAPPYPDCGTDDTEGPTCLASHASCI